jgi:hypothetical protein
MRDAVGITLGAGIGIAAAVVFLRPKSGPPAPAGTSEERIEERGNRQPVFPTVREQKGPAPRSGVDAQWARLNQQGIDALDRGDELAAVALFEQCLRALPTEPVFASNLAEALARLSVREHERGGDDDRAQSMEHLARAVLLAPERTDLAQRLAQLKKLTESEHGFWVDASEHFELSYDGSRNELLMKASQITQILERIYLELGEAFGSFPVEAGRSKIRVVLYRREGFHEVTGIGHWAGGLYDGSVRVPVEDLGRERAALDRVLRHEVTHAFVHASGGKNVPGWLNEGLAQWLETGSLTAQAGAVAEARKTLTGGELIPLQELVDSLASSKNSGRVIAAYAQALALVAYIERHFGDRVLYEMVAGCKTDTPCEITFRRRTGAELDAVLSEMAAGL